MLVVAIRLGATNFYDDFFVPERKALAPTAAATVEEAAEQKFPHTTLVLHN